MMSGARLNYLELRAADLAVSRSFYADALGLSFVDYGPSYAAATQTGGAALGLQGDGDEAVETPLALFEVDDVEAAETRVRAAGGEIVLAIFAFPGGRRFHFRDPAGNVLGAWQSA